MEDRPLDEPALIARAKRGDAAAYEQIVRAHQTIAFRTAWMITGSAAEAEEAAQDGVPQGLPGARDASGQGHRFARGCCGSSATRPATAGSLPRRRERLAVRVAEERREGGAVPSPESALLDHERRRDLLAAVESLGERDRAVIACRYLLELSEAETAAALGVRLRDREVAPLARAGRLRAAVEAGDG